MSGIRIVFQMGKVLFARVARLMTSVWRAKEVDRIYCRKLRCGIMSVDLIDYRTMVSTERTLHIRNHGLAVEQKFM